MPLQLISLLTIVKIYLGKSRLLLISALCYTKYGDKHSPPKATLAPQIRGRVVGGKQFLTCHLSQGVDLMAKNPTTVAEKWARRTAGSTQDVIDGVNAVRVNPAEQAIAKKNKLIQNFTASVQNGTWERGLRRVSLDSWKQSMIQKGAQRIATGAQAAQPKMAAFMSELLPYQDGIKSEIENMPDLTIEDSAARMTTWMRRMADFRRTS